MTGASLEVSPRKNVVVIRKKKKIKFDPQLALILRQKKDAKEKVTKEKIAT